MMGVIKNARGGVKSRDLIPRRHKQRDLLFVTKKDYIINTHQVDAHVGERWLHRRRSVWLSGAL